MIMSGGSDARWNPRRSGRIVAAFVGSGVAGLATLFVAFPSEAKTPGSTYCYYGTCHRVKTIAETQSLIGTKEVVQASFYDDCKSDPLNPCGLTSSGETFRPDRPDNAASPIYPDGTTLLVWSAQSKEAVVLRVNNAGPYWGGRKLDVSRAAADALGFRPVGVAELQIHVLDAPSKQEATYERYRRYRAVPGPVGKYASLDEARLTLAVMEAFDTMPATELVQVADASAALANTVGQDVLKIELPAQMVVASAEPVRAKSKTVQRRLDAKAKRLASKRKSHYARRGGMRRSTVASRRQARGSRYAMARKASPSRRIARSRATSRNGIATRQVRGRRPVITRSVKRNYRRMAEAQLPNMDDRRGPLHSPRLLRDLPVQGLREERSPRINLPAGGPVQVV